MKQHPRNQQRAERARAALGTYIGTDLPDSCHLQDLLTDLMHLLDAEPEYLHGQLTKGCLYAKASVNYHYELEEPEG
jgi:hypothetical protein